MNFFEQIEKVAFKFYKAVKRQWARVRFSGRIRLVGVNFRYPFYCRVGGGGKIDIGYGTFVNYDCKIISHERITIGRDCLIGPNVQIYDFDHRHEMNGVPFRDQGYVTAPVTIGSNVWIGSNCVVLKGTVIGDNSVIAAGTIVSGSVPSGSLCRNSSASFRNVVISRR